MAFPTTPVLDSFNRSDGGLGADWTSPNVFSGDSSPTILSNVVKAGASVYGSAYWDVATFGPDTEVYLTIPAGATSFSAGFLTARGQNINTGTQAEYQLQFDASAGIDLKRTINDAQSASLLHLTDLLGAGDKVGMCVKTSGNNNIIEVWLDTGSGWTLAGSVTDTNANSTYPIIANAGYIGFSVYGNNLTTRSIDDFGGGTVVVGGGGGGEGPKRMLTVGCG